MRRRAKIAVLDYEMGNRQSVQKALLRVGADAFITGDPRELSKADGLVIVGVGVFPEATRRLERAGLWRLIAERHAEDTPILGICLGLQLFFEGSEEHQGGKGFGFLKGGVERLEARGDKLPHIGWSRVRWEQSSELLDGLPDECPFFHVHSYAPRPVDEGVVVGTTEYGNRFISAVQQGSLFGVQFHPEKSAKHGLRLLENFANVCSREGVSVRPPRAPANPGLLSRVVPCLDVDAGRVVKGTNFVNLKDAGDPVELAQFYNDEGADEIAFLDITATHEKRDTIADLAKRAVNEVFVPITIGGGIRSVFDAQNALDAGADNILVNSAVVERPELLNELDAVFANQNLILAVDAKRNERGGGWSVYVAGGRVATGLDVVDWVQEGVERGAGEILVTSMDRDGTRDGYDLELLRAIGGTVNVPVIASGGAGRLEHLTEALQAGANAVLCASIFHYRHYAVRDVKQHLAEQGVMVRPVDDTPPSATRPAASLALA